MKTPGRPPQSKSQDRVEALLANRLKVWWRQKHSFFDQTRSAHPDWFATRYSDEYLVEVARKYKTIRAWRERSINTYAIVVHRQDRKLYQKCTAHMTPLRATHTPESLRKKAKQYKTFKEWREKDNNSFTAMKHNRKLYAELQKTHRVKQYRSRKEVLAFFRTFSTKQECLKTSPAMYQAAQSFGKTFFKQCTAHMKPAYTPLPELEKKAILEVARGAHKTRTSFLQSNSQLYRRNRPLFKRLSQTIPKKLAPQQKKRSASV